VQAGDLGRAADPLRHPLAPDEGAHHQRDGCALR
jgi:hypothetical protein